MQAAKNFDKAMQDNVEAVNAGSYEINLPVELEDDGKLDEMINEADADLQAIDEEIKRDEE